MAPIPIENYLRPYSMKDPHVRIIGLPDAVQTACQRVQQELLPSNKITMKLDVPWTCHSHIIGKSGNTIQPVVRKTGVSIHFPDGNKNSDIHKSNQVSINSRGQELSGLEEARCAIRELTPLIFGFVLPGSATFVQPHFDHSLLILQVHSTYNVQADLQVSNDSGSPVIIGSIKGTEWDAGRVKEATLFLLQNLCGNLAHQMPVQITLEVSPQHHSFILGMYKENLKKIMQRTATKIIFPDNNDPMIPPLKRYRIIISGAVDNVYLARQNLIGSLPLVLMFDLAANQPASQREIDQIMQTLDVSIIVRDRRGDSRQSVILRGAERNASNLYEAWRLLIKSDKSAPKAKIPRSYFLTDIPPSYIDLSTLCYQNAVQKSNLMAALNNNNEQQVNYNQLAQQRTNEDECYLSNGISSVSMMEIKDNNTTATSSSFMVAGQSESSSSSSIHNSSLSQSNIDVLVENDFGSLVPDRRAPGWEKKQRENNQILDIGDYFNKKILATKAMKQPVTPDPRTPTSDWSGYGFSKTMPGFVMHQLWNQENNVMEMNGKLWSANPELVNYSSSSSSVESIDTKKVFCGREDNIVSTLKSQPNISASNYIDSVMVRPLIQPQKTTDLNALLINLQLEQYSDLFSFQGIDVEIFSKLNDQDLKDLGVVLFGHRKKLLMAIKNLRTHLQGNLFE